MHEEEEEKTVKLFSILPFPASRRSHFLERNMKVLTSTWHQWKREEKLLQSELHENKYGYTAVEAPLFTAQKSASLIFD